MADEQDIQKTLIELTVSLNKLLNDEKIKKHTESDIKKIHFLSQEIPKLDATLFEVATATREKHAPHMKQMSSSRADIDLISKVDFALYYISQAVIEREYRTGMQYNDSAYEIFSFYTSLHDTLDKKNNTLVTSLGSVLLDIVAEESKAIKVNANLMKEDLDKKELELHESYATLQERLNKTEQELARKSEEHEKNIKAQNAKINEDFERVKDMKSELNFLKLGKAFTDFIDKKGKEKKNLLLWLIITGFLVTSIPSALIAHNIYDKITSTTVSLSSQSTSENESSKNNTLSTDKATPNSSPVNNSHTSNTPEKSTQTPNNKDIVNSVLFYAPFTLLEIFLVFYFRIFLKQFNSVNAQLLQLNMRLSVCQFIEDYAQFKKDSESDNLDKFEALIFSNLMPSADQVPSTFDGMDQLATLLKSKS